MKRVGDFSLLSKHGLALVCIARDPGMRLRDIAEALDVTERTAHAIVTDLVVQGFLNRYREGVRNRYEVRPERGLRHPLLGDHQLGELLTALTENGDSPEATVEAARRHAAKRKRSG